MSIALLKPDRKVISKRKSLVNGLRKIIGKSNVIADEVGRRAFETDALTAYRQLPLAVTLPKTTEEVAEILKYCKTHNIRVVPRGAGTSLAGGALPSEDSIVIGVSRMNQVLDINYEDRTATVQSGITNLAISTAVAEQNFFYAPDPSSQLACTIAGNIAMNSGGAHCLKYGVTTNNILGVKLVTIEGEILELGGPFVDEMGYDLKSLIVGSEGQFGIVTETIVRILPKPEGARPMLIGFPSPEAAGKCVASIIGSGIIPVAIEYMDKPAIKVCEDFAEAGYPLDVEALLIVEVEGSREEIEYLLTRITEIAREHEPIVVKISGSEEESAAIWKGRKSAFGAIGRIADYYCMDGTIPTGKLPEVLTSISEIGKKHGLRIANIFHAGDGNLHPLILYNSNDPAEAEKAEQAGADILTLCVEVGGCLTGEHGVGIEKRDLMTIQFSKFDLAQQMRIKDAFDPDWLMNPGKVFPLDLHKGE